MFQSNEFLFENGGKMKRILLTLAVICFCSSAYAGDGVTLVFQEGQVVQLNYGFKQIADAFRNLNNSSTSRKIIEASVEGGTLLIDMSQVAIVCKDDCKGMIFEDPRATKKEK